VPELLAEAKYWICGVFSAALQSDKSTVADWQLRTGIVRAAVNFS
jgi:hypothetical protein